MEHNKAHEILEKTFSKLNELIEEKQKQKKDSDELKKQQEEPRKKTTVDSSGLRQS
jgi:hypothetical protein